MKVVVQRVNDACVKVNNEVVGQIDEGLLVLVGFTEGDNEDNISWIAKKISNLRIFEDENSVMNLSVKDINGSILSVSQFTLYADVKKGNRPTYINALGGDKAKVLYDKFNKQLENQNLKVEKGIFGEDMKVTFTNDGPVTIIIDK